MSELHCTVCDAVVPAGSQKCRGCGLQLTASAVPAVHVEKSRWSVWPILLGALFVFFVIAHELNRQDAAKAADSKQAFVADWNAGRLNDAASFTARCGQPLIAEDHVLHYNSGQAGDYLVTLGSSPRLELEHVVVAGNSAKTSRVAVPPEILFTELHCK